MISNLKHIIVGQRMLANDCWALTLRFSPGKSDWQGSGVGVLAKSEAFSLTLSENRGKAILPVFLF